MTCLLGCACVPHRIGCQRNECEIQNLWVCLLHQNVLVAACKLDEITDAQRFRIFWLNNYYVYMNYAVESNPLNVNVYLT